MARCLPSGEKARQRGKSVTPLNCLTSLPVPTSQTRIVLSSPPVTAYLSSGDSDAAHAWLVWPVNRCTSLPVSSSHSRTLLSGQLHSTRLPSRLTHKPQPPSPSPKVRRHLP